MDDVKSDAVERVRILGAEAAEREARANGVERELRLEREWRTSLQEASISSAEKISQLHQEIDQLRRVSEVRCISASTLPYSRIPPASKLDDQTWDAILVIFENANNFLQYSSSHYRPCDGIVNFSFVSLWNIIVMSYERIL